jgi:hypothetical protein
MTIGIDGSLWLSVSCAIYEDVIGWFGLACIATANSNYSLQSRSSLKVCVIFRTRAADINRTNVDYSSTQTKVEVKNSQHIASVIAK